ncbi:MAG: hypothetical protein ACI9DG_001924 [Oleispira sp.]|jgi:hypothetical protein
MQAPELTNTQALIDRYYNEEKTKKAQALTRASLNLQLDANDLAMLNTIAKRFGKSRDDLAKDVLSHALIDLLTQLEPGERKLIARDADEMGASMAHEIAEENGLKDVEHKPNIWTGHERNIAKAEKKQAKELEEVRKADKKAQVSADFKEEAITNNEQSAQTSAVNATALMSEDSEAELESTIKESTLEDTPNTTLEGQESVFS